MFLQWLVHSDRWISHLLGVVCEQTLCLQTGLCPGAILDTVVAREASMGCKRSVMSSTGVIQTLLYVIVITILLVSVTPHQDHTQIPLYCEEKLDMATPEQTLQPQIGPGLIPSKFHMSPMLLVLSQRISKRPLRHSIPKPGSWLTLVAWNLILLQAGDLELNPGLHADQNTHVMCASAKSNGAPMVYSAMTAMAGHMLDAWASVRVHTMNLVGQTVYGSAPTVACQTILIWSMKCLQSLWEFPLML